jgi:deoxyribonuclease V
LIAIDAAYGAAVAGVGAVVFQSWDAVAASAVFSQRYELRAADYMPGRFYLRELPLLTTALQGMGRPAVAIVIDGYVQLSRTGAPGLGAHLCAALGGRTPIVGVAKTQFRGDDWSAPVLRGRSAKPLYVTAIGLSLEVAAAGVAAMAGVHRIPDRLREADQLARASL